MENSETKNTKNGWFHSSLRGKKNNNYPHQGVGTCNCKQSHLGTKTDEIIQTNVTNSHGNYYLNNKEEEKLAVSHVNEFGNSKEVQKYGGCPGRLFPSERRGCGFHFYFCIDNVQKSDIARIKKNKKVKNVTNEVEDSSMFQKVDSVTSEQNMGYVNKANNLPKREIIAHKNYSPSNLPRNIAGNKTINTGGGQKSTPEINFSHGLPSKDAGDSEKQNISSQKSQEDLTTGRQSILRSKKTSSNISLNMNQKIRFSSTERFIDSKDGEAEIKPAKGPKGHIEEIPKKHIGDDLQEEAIFKEYETFRKVNKRKSTMKSKGGFGCTSMMSLRRDRSQQHSIDEFIVSQILAKLNQIESQIAEMEKKCEDRETNIKNVVGISCKNAKSSTATDLKSEEDASNRPPSPNAVSSKANTTVSVKVRGGEVFVNTPEQGYITKTARSRQGSDQLVNHNTEELDVHLLHLAPTIN